MAQSVKAKNVSIQNGTDTVINTEAESLLPHSTYALDGPRCYFPVRIILLILSFFGLFICYALRVNVSVAVIPIANEQHWNDDQRGRVLSSFFWGYIWNQIPGGWLATKYGGKTIFGLGILWASIFTIVTPFTVNIMWLVLLCRIVTGFGEAVTYPCLHAILASWIPKYERSWGLTVVWSGAYVGTVVTDVVAPIIIRKWGWPYVFYTSGGLGIVWWVLWTIFTASRPEDIPSNYFFKHISKYELNLILSSRESKPTPSNHTPWRRFFTSMPVWAVIINHFCCNWGFYILLMWLPTYMKETLHFDLGKSGIYTVIPYIMMAIAANFAGFLASMLIAKKSVSITSMRKVMESIGFIGPALFLLLLSYTHPTNTEAVIFMTAAVGISGFALAGYAVNHIDISPRYAGVLMGITNTAATLPGIVGVYITGTILDHTNHNWAVVFTLAAAVYVGGLIVWLLFARGDPIDFDEDPQ